jgi:uncharacterized protein YqgC (DUF456 family)
MDVLWLIVAILLMIAGLVGCLLPFLPGPPLSLIGLLVMQLRSDPPFEAKFLWIWAAITLIVTLLDYVIPVYGTRKFGGTKYGVWGCTIGLIAGIFIPPWGLILGPFIGAFVGEMIANNNTENAWKAALGSFIGFLFGTLLKLVACIVMFYYLIAAVI